MNLNDGLSGERRGMEREAPWWVGTLRERGKEGGRKGRGAVSLSVPCQHERRRKNGVERSGACGTGECKKDVSLKKKGFMKDIYEGERKRRQSSRRATPEGSRGRLYKARKRPGRSATEQVWMAKKTFVRDPISRKGKADKIKKLQRDR